jgi:hypothetical protein
MLYPVMAMVLLGFFDVQASGRITTYLTDQEVIQRDAGDIGNGGM